MPLIQTRGAASAQGFGEFAQSASVAANYIEDVFSTYLYNGGTTTQTITNGIDLSTKGGMVWIKSRPSTYNHSIWDSSRPNNFLVTNSTDPQTNVAYVNFLTTGFTVAAQDGFGYESPYGGPYVSWTFRKQPKFFDVVTYSGNNSAQTISHSLGSAPGCMIVKDITSATNWVVYHRSLGNAQWIKLNGTDAADPATDIFWNLTNPTSTNFSVGTALSVTGRNYVAYLFAHDAGGFGLTGTDNVISCGSYTGNGSATGPVVNLGYEPQWIMIKDATNASRNWAMFDNMRGIATGGTEQRLYANTTGAEATTSGDIDLTATGFNITTNLGYLNTSSSTYIYIAIRRGPMKVPTLGTSVFTPSTRAGTGAVATTSNLSFPPDMVWSKGRDNGGTNSGDFDRLRGATQQLSLNQSDSEATASTSLTGFDVMTGYAAGADAVQLTINATGYNYVNWQFRRAPSFFDEVCYTGTGTSSTVTHNLGVTPEWVICKSRTSATYPNWALWSAGDGIVNHDISGLSLNLTAGATYIDLGYSSRFTATTFRPDTVYDTGGNGKNQTSNTYVAYLFATCAGVSKVGYYVGTGTTKQIDCGFTAGARFVLIKRVDSTGDWYVWDSARGIIAGNDPYLLLNSTAAEVTSTDYIDTYSAGFEISSTAPAAINANNGKFIFLAIA
jgi:hypothetical protein